LPRSLEVLSQEERKFSTNKSITNGRGKSTTRGENPFYSTSTWKEKNDSEKNGARSVGGKEDETIIAGGRSPEKIRVSIKKKKTPAASGTRKSRSGRAHLREFSVRPKDGMGSAGERPFHSDPPGPTRRRGRESSTDTARRDGQY